MFDSAYISSPDVVWNSLAAVSNHYFRIWESVKDAVDAETEGMHGDTKSEADRLETSAQTQERDVCYSR